MKYMNRQEFEKLMLLASVHLMMLMRNTSSTSLFSNH